MIRTRVIPCLLLQRRGLVKTIRFQEPKYLGDPINIIRIFNEKEVDELVILDINATVEKKKPSFDLIAQITDECFMPLGYGGGIRTIEEMKALFHLGIEKVAMNTRAVESPSLVRRAADLYGSQSIIVSIDAGKKADASYEVFTEGGRKPTGLDPVRHAVEMEKLGAGEIFLNSIDRDGTRSGYDTGLIQQVSRAVGIPVVACGGAGKIEDLTEAVQIGGASAVSAGSLFVLQGPHRAVLIRYPEAKQLDAMFSNPIREAHG